MPEARKRRTVCASFSYQEEEFMKRWAMKAMAGLSFLIFLLPNATGAPEVAKSESPLILSLGEDSYIPKGSIEGATGAQFLKELGAKKLEEVQVVILSNIDYPNLPDGVRDGLVDYLRNGGALLMTGGARSFGSGGYGNAKLAGMLPLQILYPRDWQPSRRGLIEFLVPSHPVFSGLDPLKMPLVDSFNNLGVGNGSLLAQFSKFERQPLMAERGVGNGWVFGIALNMAEISSQWPEGDRFSYNLIQHLVAKSAIRPR
jgi:hypothetical protein